MLPNLGAVNVLIHGLLGDGGSPHPPASTRRPRGLGGRGALASRPHARGTGNTQGSSSPPLRSRRTTSRGPEKSDEARSTTWAPEFVRREVAPHRQEWEDAGRSRARCTWRRRSRGCSASRSPRRWAAGWRPARHRRPAGGMFEAGASSGLMAALFTGGIALPHIAAHGSPGPGRPLRRPTLAATMPIGSASPSPVAAPTSAASARPRCGRRRLRRQRRQTFITSGVRADFVTTAVRTGGPGRGASACSSSRRARRASPSTARCARWAGTAPTPPSCRSSTCACQSRTWSAGEQRLPADRRAVRGRADRARRPRLRHRRPLCSPRDRGVLP